MQSDTFKALVLLLPVVILLGLVFVAHLVRLKFRWALIPILLIGETPFALKSAPAVLLIAAILTYVVILFIVLSEILQGGAAKWLTTWRGPQWVKELDYVYLALGSAGLFLAVNQLSMSTAKLSVPVSFAPYALGTAIVIRAIKTRAEIGKWNE